ncbi:MAG: flagellar protein MotY [Pontibacterium sp.]
MFCKWWLKHLGLVWFVMVGASAQAANYAAQIEESNWQLDASIFTCQLRQSIPLFGEGVFEHEAGEDVYFLLQPTEKEHFKDGAFLVSEAPPWRPDINPRSVGLVNSHAQGELKVNPTYTREMLAALHSGLMPTFTAEGWYGTPQPLRVSLSAVNFREVYVEYVNCVSQLLPVNYRQVARTAVLFPPAEFRLSDTTKARLDLIALYVQNDPKVTAIYVDGHSDSGGRRLANRDLSQKRAEMVTEYLSQKGINTEMITTRFHGERYPVVPNNTAENRARNRRVTIRLEKL